MVEIWKQFRDTQYSVSNAGRLVNNVTGAILAGSRSRQGYIKFGLWHEGKCMTVSVHRMVAEVFLPNPESKPLVNHKNGIMDCNEVTNLEWSTCKENIVHAYATGLAAVGEANVSSILTEAQVVQIIACINSGGTSVAQIARDYGVASVTISNIKNGATWKHIPREIAKAPYWRGKLEAADIPEIRYLFTIGKTDSEIGKLYGVHKGSINGIRRGKNWKNY